MAWYNDAGRGAGVSNWNLSPYQGPSSGARSYGLMDGPRGDDLVSGGTPGLGGPAPAGGSGVFEPGKPPGWDPLDWLIGPSWSRQKQDKYKYEESQRMAQWEARRRQMQAGLLNPSMTTTELDRGIQQYAGVYGSEAAKNVQELAHNARDQRMQEQQFAVDQERNRRELTRSLDDTDRGILESTMKRFDPQSKPAQFLVQTADQAESNLKGATETDSGITYEGGNDPIKDQALVTALAKVLRPNEGLMGNDAQTIQYATTDPNFGYLIERFASTGNLQPGQRKKIMEVIRQYRAGSVKQLGQIQQHVNQTYKTLGGRGSPDISGFYAVPGSQQKQGARSMEGLTKVPGT